MRFKSKDKKNIKLGDTRTITRFALFPTRVEGDIIVWLERYEAHQQYKRVSWADDHGFAYVYNEWHTVRKTAISKS